MISRILGRRCSWRKPFLYPQFCLIGGLAAWPPGALSLSVNVCPRPQGVSGSVNVPEQAGVSILPPSMWGCWCPCLPFLARSSCFPGGRGWLSSRRGTAPLTCCSLWVMGCPQMVCDSVNTSDFLIDNVDLSSLEMRCQTSDKERLCHSNSLCFPLFCGTTPLLLLF